MKINPVNVQKKPVQKMNFGAQNQNNFTADLFQTPLGRLSGRLAQGSGDSLDEAIITGRATNNVEALRKLQPLAASPTVQGLTEDTSILYGNKAGEVLQVISRNMPDNVQSSLPCYAAETTVQEALKTAKQRYSHPDFVNLISPYIKE